MSILVKSLRSILFSNLRPEMPAKLKKAAWDVFNSIASDIDVSGYNEDTTSSSTDEALERLDSILSGSIALDTELEEEILTEIIPEEKPAPRNDALDTDIELDDDPS